MSEQRLFLQLSRSDGGLDSSGSDGDGARRTKGFWIYFVGRAEKTC